MTLQFALLLIGIVVVLVVAVSAYDQGRLSRTFRRSARPETAAPPIRIEPEFSSGPTAGLDINPPPPADADKRFLKTDAPVTPRPKTADDVFRDEIEILEEVATMPLDLRIGERPHTVLPDEHIDFMLRLAGDEPVMRNTALGLFKQNEYRLEKRRGIYGRQVDREAWTDLEHDSEDAHYDELALSIQLVDGNGPIEESELNTFAQVGLKLADALHRRTQFSMEFEEALERARELQDFCDTYDVIAGLNVVSRLDEGFSGRAIERAAHDLGMRFGAMNIFHMKAALSPGSRHLFSMANLRHPGEFNPEAWDTERAPGLTLFMSVPCVHRPAHAFDRMVETARGLCQRLGGHLLDQDLKPLGERGIEVIRDQIAEIEDKMRAFGIVPGSETALRLFNVAPATPTAPLPEGEEIGA